MSEAAQLSVDTASEKRCSQWENLMRKFSRAHQEECNTVPVNIPRAHRSTKYFPTGSQYSGTWDVLGMSGSGTYTFPNGVIYEGEFQDGMFHGSGQLKYQSGIILKGHFHKGVMTERKLTFANGLEYDEKNWMYCKKPDRRYAIEYEQGLQPAGRCNITAEMPACVIPDGYYDTGDGFYNPITKNVYKADDLNAILRTPDEEEQKWIINNCRTSPESVVGPAQYLYETWLDAQDNLPERPAPAASSRPRPAASPSLFEPAFNYQDLTFPSVVNDPSETDTSSSNENSTILNT